MKMKKTISLLISILFAFTLAIPAFGTNESAAPAGSSELREAKKYVEMFYPEYADLVDYAYIGHFDQPDSMSRAAQIRPEDVVQTQSRIVRTRSTTEVVYTEQELSTALNDPTVLVIMVANNITLTDFLTCNHSVTIMALTTPVRIISASGKRHFEISNQGTPTEPLTLSFGNVTLYGDFSNADSVPSGGIHILSSDVVINGAIIRHCRASTGAAIAAGNVEWNSYAGTIMLSGSLKIYGGTFSDNVCGSSAIVSLGPIDITGATIEDNACGGVNATNISSSVALARFTDVTISGNISTSDGGGIALYAMRGEVTGSTEIIYNSCPQNGGGIWSYLSELSVDGAYISANYLDGEDGTDVYGCGIMAVGKLRLENTTVYENMAAGIFGAGAGVYVRSMTANGIYYTGDDESLVINGCEIQSNRCNRLYSFFENVKDADSFNSVYGIDPEDHVAFCGGGLYVCNLASNINETEFYDNTALYGGGIYSTYNANAVDSEEVEMTITDCQIVANTAKIDGGGIYAWRLSLGGEVKTVICANYAGLFDDPNTYTVDLYGHGGGIRMGCPLNGDHTLTERGYLSIVTGKVIINTNKAETDGGGIYACKRTTFDSGVTISIMLEYIDDNLIMVPFWAENNFSVEP